jgi:hypothetical protein
MRGDAVDAEYGEPMKGQNQAGERGTKSEICDLPENASPHHVTRISFHIPYI